MGQEVQLKLENHQRLGDTVCSLKGFPQACQPAFETFDRYLNQPQICVFPQVRLPPLNSRPKVEPFIWSIQQILLLTSSKDSKMLLVASRLLVVDQTSPIRLLSVIPFRIYQNSH
ncbi:Hypothetical_protein [Hexamita inflata]|uniref:Hypothetical_protein n=1 Tax=Hexamita inflata TaxID=28002 RepID=A0AA86Q2D5_9EUKA|nr:Hypothetical protein HINF_LOCUS32722 [Hexamita inflata]